MLYRPQRKIKVLCFLDIDFGRDVHMVLPLVYFMEKYLNCEINYGFAWNPLKMYKEKPDVVLLPNANGSIFYWQIARYAAQQKIRLFAMISEGNFWTNGTYNIYGDNRDRIIYHDYICMWNKRTINYIKDAYPQYRDKYILTGGQVFDRFSIYKFQERKEYLDKKQKIFSGKDLLKFTKVIGYAGWSFAKLSNPINITNHQHLHKNDPKIIDWMKEQMYAVEDILKKTIENNPDILFILKKHPGETVASDHSLAINEMYRLADYPNVLYLKENEPIENTIMACDIWMGFETTTAVEAWMTKRIPTILLNFNKFFMRDELYTGSIIAMNANELQSHIDEFYTSGGIKAFDDEEKKKCRNERIKEIAGFADGFNHIRTAYYFSKTIEKAIIADERKFIFSFKFFIRDMLASIGRLVYIRAIFIKLPKFKKTMWIFERIKFKKLFSFKDEAYQQLTEFYKKNNITEKIEDKDFWDELVFKESKP